MRGVRLSLAVTVQIHDNFCRSFVFLVFQCLSVTVRNVCSLGSLKGQRTPSECEMKRTRTRLRLSGL